MSPARRNEIRLPFFIVGAARSGTTLVRLMLNEHRRVTIPRESWFLSDLMDKLPIGCPLSPAQVGQAYSLIVGHERWKDWDIPNGALLDALTGLTEPRLDQLVEAVFQLVATEDSGPRWGDKTPEYVREITRLHRLFPEAKFIHVIRDGRDVSISLRKTKWRGSSVRATACFWRDYVLAGMQQGRGLPDRLYLEVAYEDIVTSPEDELTRICEFLSLPFDPKMMDFHQQAHRNIAAWEKDIHRKTTRPPRPSDVQRWKREMSAFEVLVFESVTAAAMDRANYRRMYRGPLRLLPLLFRLVDRLMEVSLPLRRRLGIHFPKLSRHI
ncbi:MAG: sulfotransferase [Sphingomonadales bacterium]